MQLGEALNVYDNTFKHYVKSIGTMSHLFKQQRIQSLQVPTDVSLLYYFLVHVLDQQVFTHTA